jgi:hypothetical protein
MVKRKKSGKTDDGIIARIVPAPKAEQIMWGKRAERIVQMSTAQLHAACEKLDPWPTPPFRSPKAKLRVAIKEATKRGLPLEQGFLNGVASHKTFKKRAIASGAARDWLGATARGGGPNAAHARLISRRLRENDQQLDEIYRLFELIWYFREIDLSSMMMLITGRV